MRIYWIWLAIGAVVCIAMAGALRTRRRLAVVTIAAAAVFLGTFGLYWIAVSTLIYEGLTGVDRLQNVLYVIVGNFQQGQVWLGLQSGYIQLAMPLIQAMVLVAAIVHLRNAIRPPLDKQH